MPTTIIISIPVVFGCTATVELVADAVVIIVVAVVVVVVVIWNIVTIYVFVEWKRYCSRESFNKQQF